ncbi:MAG: hypothetical protein M1826_007609 [Phylliscum demangeonii]|nr:MAG: hypothetical protein M1826_007609 [Phylliscum demangeonii]
MPPPRSKTTVPVGTGKFISLERKTAAMFRKQEVDDFTYAVQNDRDWLEEHVRQIFTDINRIGQKRLHDLFKTPAKLRFKTPKTILTLEELVAREPLSESFAPNRSSPTKNHKGGQKQKKADALQESDAIGEHKNSSPLRKKDKKRGKKNPAHGSDVAVDAQSSAQPSLAPSVAARATSALEALPSAAQSGSITADKASFCSSMPSPSFEISAVEPKTNPVSVIRQSIGSHPKISEVGINASTDAQLQDIAVYGDREPMNLDEHHPAATAGSASDDLTSQLHRKASTQRLHERISQLGQFQVPPPSKSLLTQAIQAERSRSPEAVDPGLAIHPYQKPTADKHGAPLPVPVRTQDFPRAQASDKARGSDGKVAQHLLIDDACASDGTEIRHPRDGSGGTVIHHLTDDACGSGGSEIRHPRDGSGGTVIHHLTDDACASGGTEIHHPRDASGGTVIHHLTEDACGSGDTVIHQPRSFGILILGTSSNKAPELDAMTSTLNEGALPDGLLCHPHPENVVRDPDPLVESQHSANVLVSYESTAKAVSQAPSEAQIDPKTAFSTAQTTTKRSAKPKQPITKAKPAPVAIKVGTASQRERDNRKANPPAMTLALQKSIGPSAGPSSKPARPLPTPLQKASASSTSKGSTSALHPPKPRALAAAARKKEQDEREAQRRLDTKREFERKKLAQQEAQKQDLQRERQTELQQRTNTKNDAKRKGEDDDTGRPTKKMQANRERPGPVVNESGNGPARHAIHKDGMERGAQPEADFENHLGPIEDRLGAIEQRRQQLAKNGAGQGRVHFAIDVAAPRMNPARPAKRGPQVEESDARVQDAGLKRGRSYVLTEGKRRKTITDDEVEPRQQTLQPPVRQNLRKLPTATSGTGGFSSLFKTTTMAQLQQQHSSQTAARALPPSTGDMAKFASAMIPFAEPSQGSMSAAASGLLAPKGASSRAGPHRGGDMARFADAKIPFAEGKGGVGSAAVGLSTGLELVPRPPTQLAMSQENLQELHLLYQKQRQEEAARREKMGLEHDSPQAAHGSDITLPSIHEGDSQEDDEWPEEAFDDHDNADGLNTHPLALLRQLENGGKPPSKKKFVAPEWAHSPNLAQILKTQQLVEPDMVFGPMQQLDMDEIFAGHPPLPPAPAAKGRGGAAKRTTAEQSSPKWTAEELITPEEIAKDWEARKLLKDKGEWEYGMGH